MQKITKAMKMVAAARLRRAQERVVAARPYANTMMRVLGRLAERTGDFHHLLLDPRGDEHLVIALVTADKGLCGGFNTNLIKAAQQFIRALPGKNHLHILGGQPRESEERNHGSSRHRLFDNFGNLRDPKSDMFWVAAAGPGANLFMALLWALALTHTP